MITGTDSLTILADRDTVLHYHDTSTRASMLLAQRLVTHGPVAYVMLVRDCLSECRFEDDVADAVRRALRSRLQPQIKPLRRKARVA